MVEALDPETLEQRIKERGDKLRELLQKNASSMGGLNQDERVLASLLIIAAEQYGGFVSGRDCVICRGATPHDVDKAIYNLNVCAGHVSYALATQK